MLFREKIQEELLKIATFWIPNKELRHKIRDNAMVRFLYDINVSDFGGRHIYKGDEESDIIYNTLMKNEPTLICRYGSNELFTMRSYLLEKGLYFSKPLKKAMSECAGFYPATNKNMTKFGKLMHSICKDIDILGVQNRLFEKDYCLKYLSKDAIFVDLDQICGVCHSNSWTKYLKGKKVLVIHPFVESIKEQYKKRELLFKNPEFLPEFELITYKAVQSIGESKYDLPYKDWFEALEKMKEDISKIDFDIAIVGAGAYGIFLAHHCKMLGKQAVHSGGSSQLIFGIGGGRWYDYEPYMLVNANLEHWIRPNENEQPKGFKKVEDGCYW